MKKNKKAMIASLVLVGAVCVGSTLAYLSDQSNTLTNSFTVGQGYVPDETLGEAVWVDEKDYDDIPDVDEDENIKWHVEDGELRTLIGNQYGTNDKKLEAGSVVIKDPVIRLTEESVDSWVYMQVKYRKGDVYTFLRGDDPGEDGYKDLASAIDDNKWTVVNNTYDDTGTGDYCTLVVRYNERLNSTKDGEDLIYNTDALFDYIKIDSTFEGEPSIAPITIKACAVQAVYTENGTKVYLEPNDAETTSPKADAPEFE